MSDRQHNYLDEMLEAAEKKIKDKSDDSGVVIYKILKHISYKIQAIEKSSEIELDD